MVQKRQSGDKSARSSPPAGIEERTLPHDLNAERAVLGAILVNSDAIDVASDILEASFFYRGAHGKIFNAMCAMAEAGKAIDLVMLVAELRKAGLAEEVGGPAYIAGLADGVPRSANVEHYSRVVRELYQLRSAIFTSNKLAREAYASERPSSELLVDTAEELLELSGSAMNGKPTKLSDLVAPGMETLEKCSAAGGGSVTGLATGFTNLDEMTAGLHPSNLILIAARTSQGKSALAMNIARNVAMSNETTLVFSLEMSKEELFLRMLASEAGVDSHHMRTGYLNESDWPKLATAIVTLSEIPLFIDDTPSVGVREVRARARQLKKDVGSLGLIIVDYIQLMKGRGRFDNRQQEIGSISRGLKAVGKELKIPVIALAQLSRAMEAGPGKKARRPQLHDLRESGDLENDADVVVFIYRPEPKDDEPNDKAELIIGKQRNGPTGTVKVGWDPTTVSFRSDSFV